MSAKLSRQPQPEHCKGTHGRTTEDGSGDEESGLSPLCMRKHVRLILSASLLDGQGGKRIH